MRGKRAFNTTGNLPKEREAMLKSLSNMVMRADDDDGTHAQTFAQLR